MEGAGLLGQSSLQFVSILFQCRTLWWMLRFRAQIALQGWRTFSRKLLGVLCPTAFRASSLWWLYQLENCVARGGLPPGDGLHYVTDCCGVWRSSPFVPVQDNSHWLWLLLSCPGGCLFGACIAAPLLSPLVQFPPFPSAGADPLNTP